MRETATDAPPFRVGPATTADAEAIAAVNVEAARAGWSNFIDPESLAGFEPPTERWRALIAGPSPAGAILVATAAGEVIGFASIAAAAGEAHVGQLATLYSRPRVWGRGAGRALMRAALEELAAAGFREAVLWTEERNERPRRVYERAGWRLDGGHRERDFLGQPIREVRYRIALAAPAHAEGGDEER